MCLYKNHISGGWFTVCMKVTQKIPPNFMGINTSNCLNYFFTQFNGKQSENMGYGHLYIYIYIYV